MPLSRILSFVEKLPGQSTEGLHGVHKETVDISLDSKNSLLSLESISKTAKLRLFLTYPEIQFYTTPLVKTAE